MCDCKLCTYYKELGRIKQRILDSFIEEKQHIVDFIEDLYATNEAISMENDVYRCLLDGDWTDAVSRLACALKKAEENYIKELSEQFVCKEINWVKRHLDYEVEQKNILEYAVNENEIFVKLPLSSRTIEYK